MFFISGELNAGETLEIGASWLSTGSGKYLVKTYVWSNLDDPAPLSPVKTALVNVS
jgi:hypothetical protein